MRRNKSEIRSIVGIQATNMEGLRLYGLAQQWTKPCWMKKHGCEKPANLWDCESFCQAWTSRCHSDLPRHGCIAISTRPPRSASGSMDGSETKGLQPRNRVVLAPCGLSHDWEIPKKGPVTHGLYFHDGSCLKDLEVEHLPNSFCSCDISHYSTSAVLYHQLPHKTMVPSCSIKHEWTQVTHGPTKLVMCGLAMLLYTWPSTCAHVCALAWRFHRLEIIRSDHALETASIWPHDANSSA